MGQDNDGNDDRGRKAHSHTRGRVLTAYKTNRRHRPNSEMYRYPHSVSLEIFKTLRAAVAGEPKK